MHFWLRKKVKYTYKVKEKFQKLKEINTRKQKS
jgi:hypothetical protein